MYLLCSSVFAVVDLVTTKSQFTFVPPMVGVPFTRRSRRSKTVSVTNRDSLAGAKSIFSA